MIQVHVRVGAPIYAEGMHHLLRRNGFHVVEVPTGVVDVPPPADVWVVDSESIPQEVRDPGSGEVSAPAPVLLIAEADEPADSLDPHGVHGRVSRDASPEAIVEAIRVVAAGGTVTQLPPQEERQEPPAFESGAEERLSHRERQVLQQIARGMTHSQIATRLKVSPHTVDTYVKRARTKLGLGNKAELTRAGLLSDVLRRAL